MKKFVLPLTLETKLGDPGIDRPYTKEDMPFIPVEYLKDPEKAKTDIKADLWAYATTMYEIFSRGKKITWSEQKSKELHRHKVYEPPQEFHSYPDAKDLYDIMLEGWGQDPDARFSFQSVLSRLNFVYDRLVGNYVDYVGAQSDITQITLISHPPTQNGSYNRPDSDLDSNYTECSDTRFQETNICDDATDEISEGSSYEERHNYGDEDDDDNKLIDVDRADGYFYENKKICIGQKSVQFGRLLGKVSIFYY